MSIGEIRPLRNHPFKAGHRLIEPALSAQRPPEIEMSFREVWLQLDGSSTFLNCLVETVQRKKYLGKVVVKDGDRRIDFDCPLDQCYGGIMIAQ